MPPSPQSPEFTRIPVSLAGDAPNWLFVFNGTVASDSVPLRLRAPGKYLFDLVSLCPNGQCRHILAFANTATYDGTQAAIGPPVVQGIESTTTLTLTTASPGPMWFFCDIHDAPPFRMHGRVEFV